MLCNQSQWYCSHQLQGRCSNTNCNDVVASTYQLIASIYAVATNCKDFVATNCNDAVATNWKNAVATNCKDAVATNCKDAIPVAINCKDVVATNCKDAVATNCKDAVTRVSEPACFGTAPAPEIFNPEPAPAPGKREQKFGFFLNWLRIV